MKRNYKKSLLLLAFSFVLYINTYAQITEEVAIEACLENYMSGDASRMELAFHPSATMKYINGQTGEFKDLPIADFIARIKSDTTKPSRKIEIVSIDMEGTAANGKIKIETDKVIMYDYMNMLKINGEWKIVSKIFSRIGK